MSTPESDHIPYLFRTEYSKLVAVLCKVIGIQHHQEVEDIVSDTFLLAVETWGKKGIPENQVAWLYAVAKNKARDYVRREKVKIEKVHPHVKRHSDIFAELPIDLGRENIQDSQLRMLFALCHPSLKQTDQVILSLRILCGFGIQEIADALLTSKEAINKRLYRAKKGLRAAPITLEVPPPQELPKRLDSVLITLYLLFNEGFFSKSHDPEICKDFCLEAMRLTLLLYGFPPTQAPQVSALLSLMCFHTSRFEARYSQEGGFILFQQQDQRKWDQELIHKGEEYLNKASTGEELSRYHLEAAIAYWHTQADTEEKWEHILQLYNYLLQLAYSPVIALNRTYALARANGVGVAIQEALKLDQDTNPLYHCLLAELYGESQKEKVRAHLEIAWELSTSELEKEIIAKKRNTLAKEDRE